MESRPDFAVGKSNARTGKRNQPDAVMTIEALQYGPDKAKGDIRDRAHPPSRWRFAFVAFELDADRVAGLGLWEDPVGDYRRFSRTRDSEIASYEQLPGWDDLVAAGFGAVDSEQDALVAEMGEGRAAATVSKRRSPEMRPYCGHVFAVAVPTVDRRLGLRDSCLISSSAPVGTSRRER